MKNVMWMMLALMISLAGCQNDDGGNGDDQEACNSNGVCDPAESRNSCPEDCDPCGNNVCDAGETTQSCAEDCKAPVCNNNGVCDGAETTQTCAAECPAVTCGDNLCNGSETATSCAADCTSKLQIQNNSSYTMYYMFFRVCSSSTWTDDLLTGTISPGQSFLMTGIPFGCWVTRLENSGRTLFWETTRNYVTNATQTFTLIN